MRIAFSLLLFFHGAAHFVGFAGPWGFLPKPPPGAAPPPPTNVLFGGRVTVGEAMARTLSIVWLAAGMAFLVVAFGVWRQAPWSRGACVAVLVSSLLLSMVWWPVARIGVLINAGILLVLALAGYRAYREEMNDQRTRVQTGSIVTTTGRGLVEYAVAGAGTPVLALHGTGGGWDQGLHATAGLIPHGFRIIAPSRLGYLRTPMPDGTSPETEADTWAALLDAVGIDRVAVISYSAGAAPAAQFALRHPDRVSALILVVPAAGGLYKTIADGPPAFVMKVLLRFDLPMWLAMRASPRTLSNLVAVPWSLVDTASGAVRAEYDRTVGMLMPISLRRHGMAYDARSQNGSLPLFPLEKITRPTLLVSAADDLYQTLRVARHASQVIPNARLLEFGSGGHLLLGHGNEMWPRVAAFIRAAEGDVRWDNDGAATPISAAATR